MKRFIRIHPKDTVVIALEAFNKGDEISLENKTIQIVEAIPIGHKMAVSTMATNEPVIKYGYPIGHSISRIEVGTHVHTHNVVTNLGKEEVYHYQSSITPKKKSDARKEIHVYQRKNGDIGIRNELWVIPTVGCVNGIANQIVQVFQSSQATSGVDGIYTFPHVYGCSQMGEDHENTKKTLQNMVTHPNAGGVLVVGLGCENNQIEAFKATLGAYDHERVKFLIAQEVEDEIEEGSTYLKSLYQLASQDQRTKADLSQLRIGLECGGSDGLSGVTANPLLGVFSDYVIDAGGTTVLTEVPEMFGGEKCLMNRCINKTVFNQTVKMVNDFKMYYQKHGQVIYENPSPGNKKGGITTLEDKSLGCIKKSGSRPVEDVLEHNQKISKKGLNLLSAPGNDLVATTALGASGCQLVLFTTGRGTPFGGFIPTMKISTNTKLYNKKSHWIDFNAGALLEGKTMEEQLETLLEKVIEVVNGQKLCHEQQNMREIAIFKNGVTL